MKWCTSLRWNGEYKHIHRGQIRYAVEMVLQSTHSTKYKTSSCALLGCLFVRVWRRARWHGPKIYSRPTCSYIWMVSLRHIGPRQFRLHHRWPQKHNARPLTDVSLFICCLQDPPPSVRTSADRCCATVAGSLCMSWRPELMWVDTVKSHPPGMNRASHISSEFKYFLVECKKSAVVCFVTIPNMIISLIPNHKPMILSSIVPQTASNSSGVLMN